MKLTRPSARWVGAIVGLLAPLALAAALTPLRSHIANTEGALILVLEVVAVATLTTSRLPGWLAAASSATWFDFFLTRPYEHFSIRSHTDVETTLLLVAVGLCVTELATRSRQNAALAVRRGGQIAAISEAAGPAAEAGSPSQAIDRICAEITDALDLRSCRFHYGVSLGNVRLRRDGVVTVGNAPWNVAALGLPSHSPIELLAEASGRPWGTFLMTADADQHPTRSDLLVAVSYAHRAAEVLRDLDASDSMVSAL